MKMKKNKSSWGRLGAALYSLGKEILKNKILISFVEKRIAIFVAKKLVLSASWQLWLIGLLSEKLIEEVLIPASQWALREGKLAIDIKDGEATIQAINHANEANNEDDFNSAIDDI